MSSRNRGRPVPWSAGYAPHGLGKELLAAICAVALLATLLTILFSSPDEPPVTIKQWSRQMPLDFATTAISEMAGTSATAEYGPPYNHNSDGQHAAFLHLQKWLGVSDPIDTANDYVLGPLKTFAGPTLQREIAEFERVQPNLKEDGIHSYETALKRAYVAKDGSVKIAPGLYEYVNNIMSAIVKLAQSGGLDGDLLTGRQFYGTDYTKPLLFIGDGGVLESRAKAQHLLGDQWGMMNETGSYPGQAWLWLYTVWYQIEPFKNSENADVLVMLAIGLLSLAFVCIPVIPGVRDIPRWVPLHRLIWREHYRLSHSEAADRRP